jgi:hypothetical protein
VSKFDPDLLQLKDLRTVTVLSVRIFGIGYDSLGNLDIRLQEGGAGVDSPESTKVSKMRTQT